MTLVSRLNYHPKKLKHVRGPRRIDPSEVSVVVPVKDNGLGARRFLRALGALHTLPREVVFVDNNSDPPLDLDTSHAPLPVHVVGCTEVGPAHARNAGADAATGSWLLFADSDCVPAPGFVSGYDVHASGAVAYAGSVVSLSGDRLSRYYASQEILVPPRTGRHRPHYLVTANALVWRPAFDEVGGFDGAFAEAAGEDVDLGFRLMRIGDLDYAPTSVVRHDFSDGYLGFVRRFVRYGRGNRIVAERHGVDLSPRFFRPNHPTAFNRVAAFAQYVAMSYGYRSGMGTVPAPPPRPSRRGAYRVERSQTPRRSATRPARAHG